MISQIGKFLKLSMSNRFMAMEATTLLFLARIAVLTLPFRWIAKTLGAKEEPNETVEQKSKSKDQEINRIGWTIRRISDHTPWNSNCLAQAITGQRMLSRRNRSSSMYFGLKRDKEGEMEAHAWLKSGDKILTGGGKLDEFSVVAVFRKRFPEKESVE